MRIDLKSIDERIQIVRDKSKAKFKRVVKQKCFKFKPFSKKQKQVLTWWCPSSPVKDMDGIIADGAIRSGKTVCMSLSFIMWAMSSFDGQNFGMCGKTIGSFRRNVLFWLKLMLRSRGYQYKDHRADNLLEVSRGNVTNYFYVFGGKDERSQDLIQGITLAGVFFDEVALMPESFVNQATGRCSVEGSKFWFNCNPDGPLHWFKVNWIDERVKKNLLYLHFTMDDNLSLSEKIKERYRSMYKGVFFDRYIRGLWVAAEGLIYTAWKVVQFNPSGLLNLKYYKEVIGLDFGYSNDPTAIIRCLYNSRDNELYICDEVYKSGMSNEEIAETIKAKGWQNKRIIADSAEPKSIDRLKTLGCSVVPAAKGPGSILAGIDFIQSCDIYIHPTCKNTIKELSTYQWELNASNKPINKPLDKNNHAMDAIRYSLNDEITARKVEFVK